VRQRRALVLRTFGEPRRTIGERPLQRPPQHDAGGSQATSKVYLGALLISNVLVKARFDDADWVARWTPPSAPPAAPPPP